ncbi:MAG: Chaperone protein DnaK [Candidatus Giovannonibacteria bacterium GW2011_GWC2_44_8]|uniref:Chaperone protein DnaK n=2 Tax=Patescibacteria group TaxID=1783273 RepID=A0A0G1JZ57_9BACT|nr:MAG: Chaperone protein DnaK [Candidatus Giovannonibacteria bacterium GW2011_GWC2_44_8]
MAKILGIDLGTTNSAMAITEGGAPKIIENKEGNRTTPSMVAVSANGERLAGLLAKRQAVVNPENTLFSIKRLIGRRWDDSEVSRDLKWLPYKMQRSSSGGVEIKMADKWYRPEEISALVLQKLKADAEEKLGSQRQATKNAGEIAGLKVLRIINEPTAAALAYGLDKKKSEQIVVYDFGGGTFDVSVLEIGDDTIEVKATGGDTHLGGDDFDQRVTNYLTDLFKREQGIDLSKDTMALARLKEAAEKAKHELSTVMETEINLPFITSGASGPKHFVTKMTRAKLEELVHDFIATSLELVKQTVKEAKFSLNDIDEVVLVGGQTRMPAITEAVKNLFGKEPHKGINPDEVVALGAAVQAGVMAGDVRDILLLDVTPLTLGIETLGSVATPMISKNTTIPTAKTQIFSTAADNQPQVEIHVLQGERSMSADNKTLGKFILDGIPPAPRGVPQIEVAFDIDANGILNVSAVDKATGKKQSITITASTGLAKEEIEKMKKDAEINAAEDAKKKEAVEIKNGAESMIYMSEKALKDAGEKVKPEDKKTIEEKIEALKKVKDGADIEAIKKSSAELSTEIQKIGEALYKKDEAPKETSKEEPKSTEKKEEDKNKTTL